MKKNDKQLGKPDGLFTATKSEIESISGYAGMIAYATDTKQIGVFDGSSWDWNIGCSGGSGGYDAGIDLASNWSSSEDNEEFDSPLQSYWTAINLGSNWHGVQKGALVIKKSAESSTNLSAIVKPIPSGYWNCYAKVGVSALTQGGLAAGVSSGLCLYDQSSGRFLTLVLNRDYNANTTHVLVSLYNGYNSHNSDVYIIGRTFYFHPYLKLQKSSGGWGFGYSIDGVEFCDIATNYNLSFMTPTHIGFVAFNYAGGVSVHTMHWMRFETL